jgi:tight adherence protein B
LSIITVMLGKKGIIILIGVVVFVFSLRHSNNIFELIENHTYGTRNYILEKFEFLFIKVKPDHVTYVLLFLSFGNAILALGFFGLLGYWGVGSIMALLLIVLGWKLPKPLINFLVERRIKAYQSQMVDGLTLLSNGLRAGLSVPQAIGMVVDEMPAPISEEFSIILQQNRIGMPLEECFDNLAARIPTEDNDMFVSSVNILRETGGNLAETFDTIVDVIRERIRLRQKIDTYVAQGMVQGYTIFAMPFALGLVYYVSDPQSMVPVFTTPVGLLFVAGALTLDIIGLMVIFKIVKIKI